MYKIAALGDEESISIFSAVGIDTFSFTDSISAGEKLKELAKDYGIIFVTENLGKELKHITDKYRDSITPSVILIPSVKGSTGEALANIRESVVKAVGTDISFEV